MPQARPSRSRPSPRWRMLRLAVAGGLAVGVGVGVALPGYAQTPDFRAADKVPPAWTQFARLVKFRFEEWIGADEAVADRFRVYLRAHSGTSDGPPTTLTVQAWIDRDGAVQRVRFPPFADAGATQDLTAVLTRGNIGEPPPPDMLQPLLLRFSLNLRK